MLSDARLLTPNSANAIRQPGPINIHRITFKWKLCYFDRTSPSQNDAVVATTVTPKESTQKAHIISIKLCCAQTTAGKYYYIGARDSFNLMSVELSIHAATPTNLRTLLASYSQPDQRNSCVRGVLQTASRARYLPELPTPYVPSSKAKGASKATWPNCKTHERKKNASHEVQIAI